MSTSLAVQESAPLVKASTTLSLALGIEPAMMIETIKAQCFKSVKPDQVSDAQLAAYISVANALPGINPLLPGMLYAYPEKNGGITPIIGPDGIFSLIGSNPDIVAQPDNGPAWYTEAEVENGEQIVTAYINHRTKGLLRKKIYIKEWTVSSNPNWQSRPRHMAEIRALKQCARQIIHAIPMDEDERAIAEMKNVTGTAETPPERPDPAALKRNKQGPSAAKTITAETPPADPTPPATPAQTPAAETPPAAEKPVEKAPPTPTVLTKDQRVTAKVRVVSARYESFGKKDGPQTPGCIAVVEGEFNGEVYDNTGKGAWVAQDGAPVLHGLWQSKDAIILTIVGKVTTKGMLALVEKIEEAPIDV